MGVILHHAPTILVHESEDELLAATALTACRLPGLRATTGEPGRVLRCE